MGSKSVDALRTISEVAGELDLPQHVLRFWERKFPEINPMKRAGGRRYYRPDEIDLLRGIRFLLHAEGYTVKGVRKIIKDRGVHHVMSCWSDNDTVDLKAAEGSEVTLGTQNPDFAQVDKQNLRHILNQLWEIRAFLGAS